MQLTSSISGPLTATCTIRRGGPGNVYLQCWDPLTYKYIGYGSVGASEVVRLSDISDFVDELRKNAEMLPQLDFPQVLEGGGAAKGDCRLEAVAFVVLERTLAERAPPSLFPFGDQGVRQLFAMTRDASRRCRPAVCGRAVSLLEFLELWLSEQGRQQHLPGRRGAGPRRGQGAEVVLGEEGS